MDSSLKRELSLSLQEELRRQVVGGETLLISLPGSFGEAFAVSDRRAFVIRDCESSGSGGCSVYSYPLNAVRGAEIVATGTGGYIQLALLTPVSEADRARVYFPSYDAATFQKAADGVAELVSVPAPSTAPVASAAPSIPVSSGNACPSCKAPAGDSDTFCGQCGEQLRQVCPECGGSSRAGSAFCSACGKKMTPFTPACERCGARVQRWMSYCTECGSAQHQSCVACGSTIQSGWTFCGNCGRQLGSGFVDPNAARAAQRRLDSFKESQREQPRPQQTVPEPVAAAPAASASNAASYHNDRGRELFEAEDLEGAISEFKQAVSMDPGNGSYHCNLAVAYDENDQDDLAFSEYRKALEIDPNDLTALLSLGYMYNEQDKPKEAEEVWNKIIQIAPHTPEAQEVRQNLARQDEL